MIRKLDCSKCGCNQADKGLIALPVTYICHDCYLREKAKEDRIKELKAALEHIAEDGCPKCGNVAEQALKG